MTYPFRHLPGWYVEDTRPARGVLPEEHKHKFKFNRSTRVQGYFPSYTTKTSQPFFSQNELEMLYLADMHPFTTNILAQPETLEIQVDGKWVKYTPDLRIDFKDGSCVFVEVKPWEFAIQSDMKALWRAARSELAQRGACFKVMTDLDLLKRPQVDNVSHLQRHRHVRPDPAFAARVDFRLTANPTANIGDLAALHQDFAEGREMIHALVVRKHLQVDLMQPLNDQTPICRPH